LYPAARPTWKELTYLGLSDGRKPTLTYHPVNAESLKRVGQTHVSVSHDGEYVYSSVLVEGKVVDMGWSKKKRSNPSQRTADMTQKSESSQSPESSSDTTHSSEAYSES